MSRSLSRRDLIAYAFLSQGVFGTDDRLAGLLPFFQPIIEELDGEFFDPAAFALQVNARYPWSINSDIAENLAPRLQHVGWLRRIAEANGDVFFRYVAPERAIIPEAAALDAQRVLAEIGSAFNEFVRDLSPLSNLIYEASVLEELLIRWIVEKRAFDREYLVQAATREKPDAALPKEMFSEDDVSESNKFKTEENYLCARFVGHCSRTNEAIFEKIVQISAVALVTEIVIDTANPERRAVQFQGGRVLYDAPFLLDCLGCSGHDRYANASFIHQHLKAFDALLSVLTHNVDEAQESLRAVLRARPSERHGPTAEALRRGDVEEDYVRDVAYRMESHLQQLGLQKVEFDPEAYPNEHRYFPAALIDDFISRIRWDRLPARERDALSVAYIMRKRGRRRNVDLSRATPLLLTRNAALADIGTRFCRQQGLLGELDVGPAVHQRQMASMIWIGVGRAQRGELARRDLIQRCADVIRCRPSIVAATRDKLRSLDMEKARQFEALMTRPAPTQMLMDLTLGADRVVTSDNIDEIFERVSASAAERVQREANAKMKRMREARRLEKRELQGKIAETEVAIAELRDESSLRIEDLNEQLEQERAYRRDAEKCARDKDLQLVQAWMTGAERRSTLISKRINVSVYLIFAISMLSSAFVIVRDVDDKVYLVVSLLAVLCSLSVVLLEKFNLIKRLGHGWIFRRRLCYIRQKASEANRDDLFDVLRVSHEMETIELTGVTEEHTEAADRGTTERAASMSRC